MTVWFPREPALAELDPTALSDESDFRSVRASHTFAEDTVSAVGDNKQPRWSSGNKSLRWSSRPQQASRSGSKPTSRNRNVRSIGVYWFVDQKDVKLPLPWSLEVNRRTMDSLRTVRDG